MAGRNLIGNPAPGALPQHPFIAAKIFIFLSDRSDYEVGIRNLSE